LSVKGRLVAVGMPVTRHPPHRSVRALLTHTALIGIFGVKPVQRIRVQDLWLGQIAVDQILEALPRPSAALTAPPQREQPVPRCFTPERVDPPQIPRHRVIVEISSHHLCQPAAGVLNRIVHAPAQLRCNIPQLRRHAFPYRLRFTVNLPLFQIVPQICVKPRKLKVSGFPAPSRFRFPSANRPT
jgi:hypothetical protein